MPALPRWGVATTLKAPRDKILAFAAHHLDLGAARIWLHFDDPTDPLAASFTDHPRITAIRCDDGYWEKLCGTRPDTHQMRQVRNVTRVLRRAKLDWVLHVDVDEFLIPARQTAEILSDLPPEQLVLRVEPWEALHEPDLPDDIFTARHFRRQTPKGSDGLARALYGEAGTLLESGMLSHTVGKCFFRTGIAEMIGRIHGARIKGIPVEGGAFHPELALLHFHASEANDWLSRLPYRLEHGAYQYRPAMQAWLRQATPEARAAFYHQIQTARPELLAELDRAGLLRRETLGLRDALARRFADLTAPAGPSPIAPNAVTG